MNCLAIDYGTKRIGLALSVKGIISPIKPLLNNKNLFASLKQIIKQYQIKKIFVGICEEDFAKQTKTFVAKLRSVLKLPIEFVEESVSTIEAGKFYKQFGKKRKNYKKQIDSLSAAIILRRAII